MSTAVAFFNNKGGVGKTTLACNYAAYEASQGREVLLIDLDPQCNSTQLVLQDEQWTEIYEEREASEGKTVMRVLRHFRAGESSIDETGIGNVLRESVSTSMSSPDIRPCRSSKTCSATRGAICAVAGLRGRASRCGSGASATLTPTSTT